MALEGHQCPLPVSYPMLGKDKRSHKCWPHSHFSPEKSFWFNFQLADQTLQNKAVSTQQVRRANALGGSPGVHYTRKCHLSVGLICLLEDRK